MARVGRLTRQLRRADILFGTAWRASPLLAAECVLAAVGSSVLLLVRSPRSQALGGCQNAH